MTALPPDDADRLAKLCGMFSSDHVGERATAAQMAHKLVKSRGLTWREVIITTSHPTTGGNTDWHRMASFCQRYSDLLSSREQEFVSSILQWRGEPTERQKNWLIVIYERVCRATR
jgi:hypothetical protein